MASIRRLSSVLLLKYKKLADDIVGYNDKYLCRELHSDTVPVQAHNEYTKNQLLKEQRQQSSAEETGELRNQALGRICFCGKYPGLVRDKPE